MDNEKLLDVQTEGGYRLGNSIYDRTGEYLGEFEDFERELLEMKDEELRRALQTNKY